MLQYNYNIYSTNMNQAQRNELSKQLKKIFAKKKSKPVSKVKKLMNKSKKSKNEKSRMNVSPPPPQQKNKSIAQQKRHLRLLMKNMK